MTNDYRLDDLRTAVDVQHQIFIVLVNVTAEISLAHHRRIFSGTQQIMNFLRPAVEATLACTTAELGAKLCFGLVSK